MRINRIVKVPREYRRAYKYSYHLKCLRFLCHIDKEPQESEANNKESKGGEPKNTVII